MPSPQSELEQFLRDLASTQAPGGVQARGPAQPSPQARPRRSGDGPRAARRHIQSQVAPPPVPRRAAPVPPARRAAPAAARPARQQAAAPLPPPPRPGQLRTKKERLQLDWLDLDLRSPRTLMQAIVAREILGPPVSLGGGVRR